MDTKMKNIRIMPFLAAGIMVVMMASCGPGYVSTGVGYGPGYYAPRPQPYYGYNYGARPYGYYRPPVVVAPPVVVRPRYYTPAPRVYGGRGAYGGGSPNARGGYGGGGFGGGGRSRGPR